MTENTIFSPTLPARHFMPILCNANTKQCKSIVMQMCEKYTHICFMYAKSAITKYIGSQWAKSVKCKFYENRLERKEKAHPGYPSESKNGHEAFTDPTNIHQNQTPEVCDHPASIGDTPGGPWTPQILQIQNNIKMRALGI